MPSCLLESMLWNIGIQGMYPFARIVYIIVVRRNDMASIKDVARLAGVSPSCVSLALNGSPLVKHETRYRIIQAAAELNYKPNQAARSLVTKEKKVIGLFLLSGDEYIADYLQPFSCTPDTLLVEMLPYVQMKLREYDYSILVDLFFTNSQADQPENSQFNKNVIDGAIFFGGLVNDDQLQNLKNAQVPAVMVCSRDKNLDYVDTDPEEGIRMAVNYLYEQGHRTIALLNSSEHSQVTSRKLAGYQKALTENDLPYDETLVESSGGSGEAALHAMERLWAREPHPTAIVAASDYIGCAILRFLYDRGLSCPRDVSIVSYGGGPVPAYTAPGLTTVDLNKSRLGEEAASILLNRLKNPKARQVGLIIPPELTVRNSVRRID